MASPYEIKRLPIDAVSWTDITAPFDCNVVTIENGAAPDVSLRSNSADSATEKTLGGIGAREAILNQSPSQAVYSLRFKKGATIASAKAASGTGPLIVTFVS